MTFLFFTLYSLITITMISAMDENQRKEITIYNSNLEKVNVHYTSSTVLGDGNCGSNGDKYLLSSNREKTFALVTTDLLNRKIYLNPALTFENAVPREVILNVTEHGELKYGERLIIQQESQHIFILNRQMRCLRKLQRTDVPLIIGSNPLLFPPVIPLPSQTLTIINKDLFQVIVSHKSFCKKSATFDKVTSIFNTDRFPINATECEKTKRKDTLYQKIQQCLHAAEKATIQTAASSVVTKTLTQLFIPQAAQSYVTININAGDIKSGDILEVSLSPTNNTIIITNQDKKIVAVLCNCNAKANRITIG